MTASLIARCPECDGTQAFAIFVRSNDGTDLVCRPCKDAA